MDVHILVPAEDASTRREAQDVAEQVVSHLVRRSLVYPIVAIEATSCVERH